MPIDDGVYQSKRPAVGQRIAPPGSPVPIHLPAKAQEDRCPASAGILRPLIQIFIITDGSDAAGLPGNLNGSPCPRLLPCPGHREWGAITGVVKAKSQRTSRAPRKVVGIVGRVVVECSKITAGNGFKLRELRTLRGHRSRYCQHNICFEPQGTPMLYLSGLRVASPAANDGFGLVIKGGGFV